MALVADLHANPRSFGCEYEVTMPLLGVGSATDLRRVVSEVLTSNGVRSIQRNYSHEPVPDGVDAVVEMDSSVEGESRYHGITWFPLEVKTRICRSLADWESFAPKMLEIVRYLGGRINHSTGGHIHVATPEVVERPAVLRSIYNFMQRYEPLVYSLIPPSRFTCGYAKPMENRAKLLHGCKTLACYRRALADMDRYRGLNWVHAFGSQESSRLEFRYAQSTLSPEKAKRWLCFCLQIVNHCVLRNCQAGERVLPTRDALDRLMISAGFRINTKVYSRVCPELRKTGRWLIQRYRHFNQPLGAEVDSDG
jgi:hypothetical protein